MRRRQGGRRPLVEPAEGAPVGGVVRKLFLLSPARVNGVRAAQLLNPAADFPRARALRQGGLPLADVFTFASGLYFRGKITYARHFAARPDGAVRLITSNAGLVEPDMIVHPADLRAFGEQDIEATNLSFLAPLRRDAEWWARRLAGDGVAVLLGSIATPKYRDVLLDCFGERLMFPRAFVGRGDMSRGGLLLRQVREGRELEYVPVRGAVLRGPRAPRIGGR